MSCQYNGHLFVPVDTFESDIYLFTDADKMQKTGTQKYQHVVCRGCGGTVIDMVKDGWTPSDTMPADPQPQ